MHPLQDVGASQAELLSAWLTDSRRFASTDQRAVIAFRLGIRSFSSPKDDALPNVPLADEGRHRSRKSDWSTFLVPPALGARSSDRVGSRDEAGLGPLLVGATLLRARALACQER